MATSYVSAYAADQSAGVASQTAAGNTSGSAAPSEQTKRGAYLARAGNCMACHTAVKEASYAGGLRMETPLGAIYTTNITPDKTTGIGAYTEADFSKALREGVARDGHRLYPAMPYPSYAKMSDADVSSLYAYFMHDVAPVNQANRTSQIPWPLNMRWPLALWNVAFLNDHRYVADASHDADWNRGAYLVEGMGHCGACHTARGVGFQELALSGTDKRFLGGARIDHWYASNLRGDQRDGLGRWSESDLTQFLKTGVNQHATAFGSMQQVVTDSTQYLSDADTKAIAKYIKSLGRADDNDTVAHQYNGYDATQTNAALLSPALNSGASVYGTFCIHCHAANGHDKPLQFAPLAGNPNILAQDPTSLINVTLNGTAPLKIAGNTAAYPMPRFKEVLTDTQIADVLTFIRAGWNNQAPAVSESDVAALRKATATGDTKRQEKAITAAK
jgi:mono/diheme cytochrome c family protein